MSTSSVRERIERLREAMRAENVDVYFITTADYHGSEYVADFFKARAFFSGFTGSNGDLVVTHEEAFLWTDGRYFLQAERELQDSGITLMRMGEQDVPTVEAHFKKILRAGMTLAFDGRCVTAARGKRFSKIAEETGARIVYDIDLADAVWEERPQLPLHPITVLQDTYTGRTFQEKLSDVRTAILEQGADAFVLSRLDDIMWLTNLRGADVACNPVALSYLFVTPERTLLFVQEEEITEAVRIYAEAQEIILCDYHEFFPFLYETADTEEIKTEIRKGFFYDEKGVSTSLYESLKRLSDLTGIALVEGRNPSTVLKAVKNETELAHTRRTYLLDSVVLTEFLYYVKTHAGKEEMSEVSLAEKLDGMRRAKEGFIDLSFPTISGFGANGAIVHYEATPETDARVEGSGFYLVDSGATYMGGTTDVTRTLAIGEVTDEMKEHFTKTLVGMLRLADAHFLEGSTGRNLDILARLPLWESGLDYKHGTGHGVGYMLNVHEGPQNIRWQFSQDMEEAELSAGMLVSDEPGVYITGSHGVRIENILEVVPDVENEYGRFLKFAHLTYVPIDLDAVDTRYMSAKDISLLNEYHAAVLEKLLPHIRDEACAAWLKNACQPV